MGKNCLVVTGCLVTAIWKYLAWSTMIVALAKVEFPDAKLSVKAIENRTEQEEIVWPWIL